MLWICIPRFSSVIVREATSGRGCLTAQEESCSCLLTRKQALLLNCLGYAGQNPQLLGQYVAFTCGFCHGSCIAIISQPCLAASTRKGAITLFLLFCTLYCVTLRLVIAR